MVEIEFDWRAGERNVRWIWEGSVVEKKHAEPPYSVTFASEPDSVVVVEDAITSGPANAIVYEPDGTERLRLHPPALPNPIGFDQVFQSVDRIEAVFVTRQGDVHGEPDLLSGELRDVRDWR